MSESEESSKRPGNSHIYSEFHSLSNEEIGRFSRQLILDEIGVEGQQKLKHCAVLVVGAGGLGCPVSIYLAAAGIGRLGIVDYDTVEVNNLHRQILHRQNEVGKSKAKSVERAVKALNSAVNVTPFELLFEGEKALGIIADYDIVVDCTDNVATRYLLNDACVLAGKPLVSGSALRFEGQLTVYHATKQTPCYRCVFPEPPPANTVTNCSEGGVLGPVVGVIGSIQAIETIKMAVGLESSYAGFLFLFDGLRGETRKIKLRQRNPNCAVCGDNPTVTKLQNYAEFCGTAACDKVQTLKILPANKRITAKQFLQDIISYTIDTRPEREFKLAHLPGAINIPLETIENSSKEQILKRIFYGKGGVPGDEGADLIVVCHRGNDSQLGVLELDRKLAGMNFRIRDIRGGVDAWAKEVDVKFPIY